MARSSRLKRGRKNKPTDRRSRIGSSKRSRMGRGAGSVASSKPFACQEVSTLAIAGLETLKCGSRRKATTHWTIVSRSITCLSERRKTSLRSLEGIRMPESCILWMASKGWSLRIKRPCASASISKRYPPSSWASSPLGSWEFLAQLSFFTRTKSSSWQRRAKQSSSRSRVWSFSITRCRHLPWHTRTSVKTFYSSWSICAQ